MAELGSLFYNVRLRDLTDQDLQEISKKFKSICVEVDTNGLKKQIENYLATNPVSVKFDPQITSADIENKLTGKIINAEIKPLESTLVSNINAALKGQAVNLDTFTIDPTAINNAIRNALTGAGFTAAGDAFADSVEKSVKARLGGTYTASVQVDIKKLADSVIAGLEQGEKRGIKIDTKNIKKDIEDVLKSGVKVGLDPQVKVSDIEGKLQGKVVKAEIMPLATKLRAAIQDACKVNGPTEVQIGPKVSLLQRLVNQALNHQGYMVTINTVTGLDSAIKRALVGNNSVVLTVDPTAVANSMRAALGSMQTRAFGLEVQKDVLRNSINTALAGRPFSIQIAVMQDQARRAVQNALNNARMVGKDDALAYQRLQTGELKAAQAELARLKAAHQGAVNAANAHASASISLGGALGSNIKIAGELGSAMASLYSIHAAKAFLGQVIEIGGELEHQKIALETIYGSESKMESLYSQIKGLARTSPFGVMDLTKNIKQLSAYGVAYNEVYDTAKRLADISAATSVDINRLILAFGKTKNRTFLDGLEAKQFAYANIPIYDALSKKLTELEGKFVSVKDVMGRIKKREIGFDMVKDILWDMTDEGGKFYNMQEKLAGSVKTSWKLVADNIQLMFGEIAESGIGAALKDVGAIAQNLTRNWETLSKVVATGAGAFGIYKLAVLACNTAIGTSAAVKLKEVAATNSATAANAEHVMTYRELTLEEAKSIPMKKAIAILNSRNIFVNKTLTSSQIKGLATSKILTKDLAARAIAMGKISPMQARYLIRTGIITKADLGAAMAARKRGLSINLMGKDIRVASFRFKELAVLAGMTTKAMLGFVFNPATLGLAALSAGIALLSKNNEEMEKAKEIGDGIFSKAIDGAKELKDVLESSKPSNELSNLELAQGIERLEQAIKDYSPTPIDDINKSLVAQDGHINTLIERYDVLKGRAEDLSKAFESIGNNGIGQAVTGAIKATDGNWFTKYFDDNLDTNGKDLTNALKRREDAIAEYATNNKSKLVEIVNAAISADERFAKAVEGLSSYEAKFSELISNFSKYGKGYMESGASSLDITNFSQINAARKEFLADTDRFAENLKTRLNSIADFDINSEEGQLQLTMALRSYLDSMESWGDDAKELWAKQMEQIFSGVHLTEDKIGKEIRSAFSKILAENGAKTVNELIKEWDIPAAAEIGEKLGNRTLSSLVSEIRFKGRDNVSLGIQEIFDVGMTKAKDVAMTKLGETTDSMQEYLQRNPLEFFVGLVFNTQTSDVGKMLWDHGDNAEHQEYTKKFEQWSKGADSVKDIADKAVEDGEKIKERLEAAKKNTHSTKEHIAAIQKEWDDASETYRRAGYGSLEDAVASGKSKGDGGSKSQKDTIAEQFKQRFKDLKDAWSEFQKWQKSVGDESAANTVADSGLFGDMKAEDIPRNAEQFKAAVKKLKSELESAGVKGHSQRESLLNEILKNLLDIDKSMVDERIQAALEAVEKAFEKQTADFNLYEKIREATGNEQLAYAFSFGIEDADTDYVGMVKNHFRKLSEAAKKEKPDIRILDFDEINEKNVTILPDELQKAWREAAKNINKYREEQRGLMADMMSDYQTTQEEIVKLQAEAADKIKKIQESMTSGDLSNVMNGDIIGNNLIDKIKTNLDYEIFKRSGEYLQFFNATLSLTIDSAEKIGAKIRENLDKKLQQGQISAKEYCDEIEKINERLEEVRRKQSDFGNFLKGGLTNVFEQKNKQALSDYTAAADAYARASEQHQIALELGDEAGMKSAESAMEAADSMMKGASAAIDGAQGALSTIEVIDKIVHEINDTVQGIKGSFDLIADMADSFGIDASADTGWGAAGAFLDAFSQASQHATDAWDSLNSGNVGGVIQGVVGSITSWFTVFNRWHDAKLQKDIERSQMQFQKWQYIIDSIERRMEHFLGNTRNVKVVDAEKDMRELDDIQKKISGIKGKKRIGIFDLVSLKKYSKEAERLNRRVSAYEEGGALGYERELMNEQLSELERQKADMEKMKKKDPEAIADITDQIDEQRQAIRDFAEEMANITYGIGLNDWAEQIGDSLVDAFARGEDAAEAFDKTASSIMRNLVSKMISQDIIAPMFNDLRDYLFGADGMGGAYGRDFQLDASEVGAMKEYLDKIKNDGIPAAEALFNAINEATGGLLNDAESADNSVRAGIQSLTENTGDLLASYVNAIRGDVSAMANMYWPKLLDEIMPQYSVIAEAQTQQLRMIAENTRRNMIAAEAIQQSNQDLVDLFTRATRSKDNGFYVR